MLTEQYKELLAKAELFAQFYGYDLICTDYGCFDFYNSPIKRSFSFKVDPETFNGDAINTILKNFEGRLAHE